MGFYLIIMRNEQLAEKNLNKLLSAFFKSENCINNDEANKNMVREKSLVEFTWNDPYMKCVSLDKGDIPSALTAGM